MSFFDRLLSTIVCLVIVFAFLSFTFPAFYDWVVTTLPINDFLAKMQGLK